MKKLIVLPLAAALAIVATGVATGVQAANQKFEKSGWTYIETQAPDTGISSFLAYRPGEKDSAFVIKCDAPGANALYLGFFGGSPGDGKAQETQGTISIDGNEAVQLPVSLDGQVGYIYDAPSIAKITAFMNNGKAFEFKAPGKTEVVVNMPLEGFKDAHAWVAKNCTKA